MSDQTALDCPRTWCLVLPRVRGEVGAYKLPECRCFAGFTLVRSRIVPLSRIVNSREQPASHPTRFLRRDRVGIADGVAAADPLTVSVLDHIGECAAGAVRPPALLSQAEPSKLDIPVEAILFRRMRS